MPRPPATLSLDLDNLWAYLKVHGDREWKTRPSFLPLFAPLLVEFLHVKGLAITVFVVGEDAASDAGGAWVRRIAEAGHEIGNHSMRHEPWAMAEDAARVAADIAEADEAIREGVGRAPLGFRAPGFAVNENVVAALRRLDYEYDASTWPTFVGPLARCYYRRVAGATDADGVRRARLFGRLRDALAPLRPYLCPGPAGAAPLVEMPVTTMPLTRLPIHFSYLLWLSRFGEGMAVGYLKLALALCRLRGVAPSLLLHPVDFLGREDAPNLAFFPAMDLPRSVKLARTERLIDLTLDRFDPVPLWRQARAERAALLAQSSSGK